MASELSLRLSKLSAELSTELSAESRSRDMRLAAVALLFCAQCQCAVAFSPTGARRAPGFVSRSLGRSHVVAAAKKGGKPEEPAEPTKPKLTVGGLSQLMTMGAGVCEYL